MCANSEVKQAFHARTRQWKKTSKSSKVCCLSNRNVSSKLCHERNRFNILKHFLWLRNVFVMIHLEGGGWRVFRGCRTAVLTQANYQMKTSGTLFISACSFNCISTHKNIFYVWGQIYFSGRPDLKRFFCTGNTYCGDKSILSVEAQVLFLYYIDIMEE